MRLLHVHKSPSKHFKQNNYLNHTEISEKDMFGSRVQPVENENYRVEPAQPFQTGQTFYRFDTEQEENVQNELDTKVIFSKVDEEPTLDIITNSNWFHTHEKSKENIL